MKPFMRFLSRWPVPAAAPRAARGRAGPAGSGPGGRRRGGQLPAPPRPGWSARSVVAGRSGWSAVAVRPMPFSGRPSAVAGLELGLGPVVQLLAGRVAGALGGGVQDLLPGALLLHLRDRVVDVAAGLGAGRDAHAVALHGEGVAHHLELAGVLRRRGEAGEDDVIGGDGVHLAGFEVGHALGVAALLDQLHALGVLVLDLLRRGGAGDGAEVLAVERLGAGDLRIVGADQQVLAGHEVGPGEVDPLLALIGDRVGGDDHVDLAALEGVLAVGGGGLDPFDLVLGVAELVRDVLGDLDVEAGRIAAALAEAEARLVVLDADADAVAAALAAAVAAVAVAGLGRGGAGGHRESGRGGQRGDGCE